MTVNDITYKIRGAAFQVYNELGPGLLESIYQEALALQLTQDGLHVQREVHIPVYYNGTQLTSDLKLDIIVEDQVIVELKSVKELTDIYKKQLNTYLKLSGKKVGLLINFNTDTLDKDSIVRIINGAPY